MHVYKVHFFLLRKQYLLNTEFQKTKIQKESIEPCHPKPKLQIFPNTSQIWVDEGGDLSFCLPAFHRPDTYHHSVISSNGWEMDFHTERWEELKHGDILWGKS